MTTFWQDVQYGVRMLVKRPAFTIVAALSLALGIGANTVIFSLINTTLLRPLPFDDPDSLVVIWTVPAENKDARNGVNFSAYTAFRQQSQSFEGMGALTGISKSLGAEENGAPAERINGWRFAPSVLQVLRVKPTLGRFYTEDEDQIDNAAPVIVITHRLWKRHFNSDPAVLGKKLTIDQQPITVIGVLPENFSFFGDDVDFITPLATARPQVTSKLGFSIPLGRLKRASRCGKRRRRDRYDRRSARQRRSGAAWGTPPGSDASGSRLRRSAQPAPDPAGRGRVRPADRMRQRGWSVAGPCGVAQDRSRRSHGSGAGRGRIIRQWSRKRSLSPCSAGSSACFSPGAV
jgi:hypothetical protein